MYVDIHCHLDALSNPQAAVSSAEEAGVSLILTNGLHYENNKAALLLQEQFSVVKAALGLYPNDAVTLSDEQLSLVYDQIRDHNPVAIGEIGLDYYHDATQKERMKSVFTEVLALAEELKKPVLVHSRKAEADVLDALSSFSVVANLHCFGGSLKLARRGIDAGHYFSLPTSVVRATHFQRLSQEVPADRLLSETDAPWMSPNDLPNEPANVLVGVQAIAAARKEVLEDTRSQIFMNSKRFLSYEE